MGGLISDITGQGTRSERKRQNLAMDQFYKDWERNQAFWERQFGSVSDSLKKYMEGVLGLGPAPEETEWQKKFKETTRQEVDSGMRPGEEAAREALKSKVAANPKTVSTQAYAKGLKDIVKEGSAARGNAFRSGMREAELTPFNMGATFMGRQPYTPQASYMPNYGHAPDPRYAEMAGSGLGSLVKGGKTLYNDLFGSRTGGGYDTTGLTSPNYSTDEMSQIWEDPAI